MKKIFFTKSEINTLLDLPPIAKNIPKLYINIKTFLNVKMIYPNKYFELLTNTIIFENVNNENMLVLKRRERDSAQGDA